MLPHRRRCYKPRTTVLHARRSGTTGAGGGAACERSATADSGGGVSGAGGSAAARATVLEAEVDMRSRRGKVVRKGWEEGNFIGWFFFPPKEP
jgi:hypothetical protein